MIKITDGRFLPEVLWTLRGCSLWPEPAVPRHGNTPEQRAYRAAKAGK